MLTLQKETEALFDRFREENDRSGINVVERIAKSTATYHNVPIKVGYLPKIYTEEGYLFLKEQIEFCWQILVKVIRHYFEDAQYRELFGFEKELEELILNRPDYETLLPVCRLDLFLNEETGEFRFCEFNTDGSSAMNENREMSGIYPDTEIFRAMSENYRLETAELFDTWAETFLKIYRETGKAERGKAPNVAIVDFMETISSPGEFEEFRRAFTRAGCECSVAEIRNMTFDGEHLYAENGMRVDAVYRRAVTADIMEHRDEVRPFLEAVKSRKVCLIGDFCTQIIHDKILFCILSDLRTERFLSEEEIRFIRDHVPCTMRLTKNRAADPAIRSLRKLWILKPADSYGADDVHTGSQCTQEEWERLLDSHADGGYLVQEYVKPYETRNIDYTKGHPEEGRYKNMTGLYLYGGKLAGIYTRSSVTPVISVEGDEHEMMTYVAYKRQI